MEFETCLALLRKIGLNEYESKAYLILLTNGSLTAEQISRNASIPLPRVYDTLMKLVRIGIVMVSESRPKLYKPVQPDAAVKNIKASMDIEFEKKILGMEKLSKIAIAGMKSLEKKCSGEEENFWFYKIKSDPKGIERQEAERLARKEYFSFSGDMSWIERDMEFIKAAIKKKVDFRIIADEGIKNGKNLKLAKSLGIKVRIFPMKIRGEIVDGKMAIFVLKIVEGRRVNYEILKVFHTIITKICRDYFLNLWGDAKEI